jgi:predicted nucleic acid-binding protein
LIAVDASVVANAIADDQTDGNVARGRLTGGGDLVAPDLVDIETFSVLRRRWLAGEITARRFSTAITDLEDLELTRFPTLPLIRRAYELRANLTAYDAVYVALAERLGCTLVTADARLARAPGIRCAIDLVST